MSSKHDSEATVAVNIEELRNSKDAVIMRLMALQSYIADLSKAYVEHVNNVITGGPATIDIPAMPSSLSSHMEARAGSPGPKAEADAPKKRKRAPVDPNAPKRALTPYFLYMQQNRQKIAADLGGSAKPKDVADEGTRRWQSMDPKEKELYKTQYLENYEAYKRDMAAYKAGHKGGDDDAANNQLQQGIAGAAPDESPEDDSESSESEEEEQEEEEEVVEPSPSPVPVKQKTPSKSASAKRRRSDIKAVKEVAESPVKPASPVKRGRKAAEPASAKSTPAESKRRSKKRKSEA
ncbi:hypothetical protein N7539_007643 [Penicillium diatomitis]|uniref:HMG box domain-containing protein n=1 Tax=Penicillium diatomitis TaxID=2819901 RepID=A0A9X0BP14_9EURO|nr:uncharacterized protein N7539_007643 [Penicillium diatomitis]KAJ5477499.1 hypothetical protein N7539_007643 [Penicillium diatomitis]